MIYRKVGEEMGGTLVDIMMYDTKQIIIESKQILMQRSFCCPTKQLNMFLKAFMIKLMNGWKRI